MIIDLSGKVEVLPYICLLTVFLDFYDGLLDIAEVPLIDFQGFLLQSFSGVGPVAFRRFLHSEYVPGVTTTNPYLTEIGTSILVLQTVDSEDLLKLHLCQSELVGHILIIVLELRLVEKDGHVGIGYDGFLQNVR